MPRPRSPLSSSTALALLLTLLAGPGLAQENPAEGFDPVALHRSIDAWLAPLVASGDLSGSLLVARDGTVVYERAFGMADYELEVPNTLSTRFGIASLTKPMTVILAIQLIESGALGLEDPVSRWISDFPRGDEITVAHLLRHQSGLPHRVTEPSEEVEPTTAADMVERAAEADLLFPPGSDTAYSSTGYSVLARILELAGGHPWAELLDEFVLAPAGAVHTAHPHGHDLMPGRASSYFRGSRGPINAALKDLSFLVGAGSLYSTPRDVYSIQQRLVAGGYGDLARQNLVREGRISWNGITNGFRAFGSYDESTGVSVVFAGNLFSGADDFLRDQLPRLAAGEEVAAPEVPAVELVVVPPEARAELEGIYRLGPGSEEPIRFEGDIVRYGDWVLLPTGVDRFFSPQDYETVRVARGENGSVEALVWGDGEKALRFPRVGPLP